MKNCSISSGEAFLTDELVKDNLAGLIKQLYVNKPLCYVHSFGCQQNVSDGERIKGQLAVVGYDFTENSEQADLIIFNTCAVRENAEERVFGLLGELKHLKENNPSLVIAVCGCMAQQKHVAERISDSYKHVDLVFGTFAFSQLYQMLYSVLDEHKRVFNLEVISDDIPENITQIRGNSFIAYVPIMYGCNNFCSYCIVPYVRGRERSRKPDDVICEVKSLVSKGYKEIILLGQNVNSYSYGFVELLKSLDKLDGDFRIRFISSHPKDASFELLDTIISSKKICKHLHLPLQSGCDRILKLMNRKYKLSDYMKIVDYARKLSPEFSFSTDIIVGFPGETFEEFRETVKALRIIKFDNIYSYVYSKRSGTKAAEFEDNISEKQKGLWLRELILEQREVSTSWLSRFVGKTVRVLVESQGRSGEDYLTGKCDEYIIVEFKGNNKLIGNFVNVKITKAMNWALLGEIEI